jgi:hypothetical protein
LPSVFKRSLKGHCHENFFEIIPLNERLGLNKGTLTLFKFFNPTVVLLRFFKRCGSQCKNGSPDLHKFAALRRQISSVSKCSESVSLLNTPSN